MAIIQMSALRHAVQKASANHLQHLQEAAMRTAYVVLLTVIALLALSVVGGAVFGINYELGVAI